jgi:two-component system cell cycle sensor histidine kinase/response regulator CckA
MRQRRWLVLLWACVAVIGGYVVLGEPWRSILYYSLGFAAIAGCLLAARKVGARRLSWTLLGLGMACFVAGDLIFDYVASGFPSTADVAYLVAYPLLAAGIAALVPRGRASAVGAGLDAALLTTAAGAFIFLFWLEPLFSQSGESQLGKLVSCAYPLGDLLILALLALSLLRVTAQWLLATSFTVLLTTDLVYSGLQAHNSYSSGSLIDIGWIASYGLLAAAALHPKATATLEPRPDFASWRRLVLVGLCLFSVPLAGLVQALTGEIDEIDLIVFGAAIAALACARLAVIALERARSEQHFRALIETTHDIVAIVEMDGSVRYVSPSVERILGLPPSHYAGRKAFEFVHPEVLAAAGGAPAQTVVEEFGETRCRIMDAQGVYKSFAVSGRLLQRGPFAGALLVNARDISEHLAIEAELAAKQEELRQSQRLEAVGQLAGGVAHDFNNLLTAIGGYAEMARHEATALGASTLEADLSEVLGAAERAGTLVQQLLTFSHRQRLEPRPLELNATLRGLDRLLQRVIGEQIELATVLAAEPIWVEGDRGQLEQVVVNLAVNARDAMPGGGTLTLALAGDADRARLTVRDTGIGMDAETRRRAFEPFFTTKDVGRGTGLGLATVYGIVTLSRGTVEIDSAPGAGATFTVTLPRIAPPAITEEEATPSPGRVGGRILVVEDEQQVRAISARMLRDAGYEVLEAGGGEQALRLLEQEGPEVDLLLTDVVMPRLSGPELAARARALQPRLGVLFCSGYANDGIPGTNQLAEAHFLGKPFAAAQLLRAVESAIADGRARSC